MIDSKSQDNEKSRQQQSKLQSRERAHQATQCMRDEVEELRKTRRSESELREEAYQDAISQDVGNNLETDLWEIQSTVNKLTRQIKELQEVINSLSESQDFKDLETASCSGSAHGPGKQSVFPSFSSFAGRDQCHHFNTRDLRSLSGDVFDNPNLTASNIRAS